MTDLASREFLPACSGATPLRGAELEALSGLLGNGWTVVDAHHLEKDYSFEDFSEALAYTNRVGAFAERVDHHPQIELGWGRVKLTIWSHDAGGLTERDFVWAAKVDALG